MVNFMIVLSGWTGRAALNVQPCADKMELGILNTVMPLSQISMEGDDVFVHDIISETIPDSSYIRPRH